jgi:hypothetical protein
VHFSFGWAGALGRTSYWTGNVSSELPPPPVLLDDQDLPRSAHADPRIAPGDLATMTRFALRKGHHYRIQVSGRYATTWDLGAGDADAECSQHDDGVWRRWVESDGPGPSQHLDLTVNGRDGWRPVTDDGNGCDATHHYYLDYTPTYNTRLHLLVHDLVRYDDTGGLTVTVTKRPALPST